MSTTSPTAATLPGSQLDTASRAVRALRAIRRFVTNQPLGTAGLIIVAVAFFLALFGPSLAPHNPNEALVGDRLEGPSADFPLGTDRLGRDSLSRVLYGARVTVIIGLTSAILAVGVALVFGGLSGFLGGAVDLITQRVVDIGMAVPALLVVISLTVVLPEPSKPWDLGFYEVSANVLRGLQLIIVFTIVFGIRMIRVVRASVLSVRGRDYVAASRAVGAPQGRIFLRHVLPNVMPILIVLGTVDLGAIIFTEASVSFLGYGLPPDVPSWGVLLSDNRDSIQNSLWPSLWPGVAIAITVFGVNVFGDALRDVLDPRLRT